MATAPMIDERPFQPASIDQARSLHKALLEAGTSHVVARGLIGWLCTLPEKRSDDPTSNVARRDYRRELLRLGKPPWVTGEKGAYTQWLDAA